MNREYNLLLDRLKERFESHPDRHPDLSWKQIEPRLSKADLEAIAWMEETGGEPDVMVWQDQPVFADFSKETPAGRRKCSYDGPARLGRKKNAPETSAAEEAEKHHTELLDEQAYRYLQSLQTVDEKSSSWMKTPEDIRIKGGALFGDARYGRVFAYHNGADSWYSTRGFRCLRRLQ